VSLPSAPRADTAAKALRPTSHRARWDGPNAALPYAELRAFMMSCERESLVARAREFAILTAARTSEAIGAACDEIEGDVWTVPKGCMRAAREHRVPLSARALAILEDMKGKGARIFSGARAGKPLQTWRC
jgi:integrase